MGNKVQYGVVLGKMCSGKTTVCKYMENGMNMGVKVINMEEIQKANPPMNDADPPEPIEGEVCKIEKVEEIIKGMIAAEPKTRWVFDGYLHTSEEAFLNFIGGFGTPDFITFLNLDKNKIMQRVMTKNEIEGEIPEEMMLKIKEDDANFKAAK